MTEHIVDILVKSEEGVARTVKNAFTAGLWKEVVDQRVQKHTEAIKIRNRVLYVATATAAWAQELTFLKKEIIEKFNARAGEEAICDIRFKSAGGI